jgi:hypothetical protein
MNKKALICIALLGAIACVIIDGRSSSNVLAQTGTSCNGNEAGVSWQKRSIPTGGCVIIESVGQGQVRRRTTAISCPDFPPL